MIVRDLARRRSSWRSDADLDAFLRRHGVPGLAGVDTRRLTRHIRDAGAMPGCVRHRRRGRAEGGRARPSRAPTGSTWPPWSPAPSPTRSGRDRAGSSPTTSASSGPSWSSSATSPPSRSCRPATTADEVLARRPDGVFLSNGPGDPAAVGYAADAIRGLLGQVPVFGICLGHQLLATALGASTFKLPFGHHGGNHPVRRLDDGNGRDHQPEPQLLGGRRAPRRRSR